MSKLPFRQMAEAKVGIFFSMLISMAAIVALAKIGSFAKPAPSWAGWVLLGSLQKTDNRAR